MFIGGWCGPGTPAIVLTPKHLSTVPSLCYREGNPSLKWHSGLPKVMEQLLAKSCALSGVAYGKRARTHR
jgi:hypothetical protein